MAFEIKPNTGSLFRKEDKEGTQPDYEGNVDIDGKKLRIAAWIRESKAGKKYLSLKFSPPYKKDETPF